ncbi:cob(II)yrinic acid a,c-diamide reductase [Fulvimarina manganoxydans]|uniref:Cob(II)yrinic acid a,c-diamide reductase n=2 Tax=Fulvimarina manganoxydans TaxID=937218 RepID=A0A1W2DTV5_9HYPH|nr:flavin reductase [Fulvimarina manganoxydans]MEE2951182.1 flavin reductase [Pseudomonadota bacterium]SMD00458.1 cob(II)yrinic acid a,c-diamide reductase [Fulvimarina manganoxydans]
MSSLTGARICPNVIDEDLRPRLLLTTSRIDPADFRAAMRRFAASVCLVTTDGPAGRRGVTVTSSCSVSDDPPTLLVCLNTSSPLNQRFEENGCFALNVLGHHDEKLARAFAGEGKLEPEERFALGDWETHESGAPILKSAPVAFDCRLIDTKMVATHRIIIGEVVSVSSGALSPSLVYLDRAWRAL